MVSNPQSDSSDSKEGAGWRPTWTVQIQKNLKFVVVSAISAFSREGYLKFEMEGSGPMVSAENDR